MPHSPGAYPKARAMRVPRLRFTMRWMMIAVAVIGVVLGIIRRGTTFSETSSRYFLESLEYVDDRFLPGTKYYVGPPTTPEDILSRRRFFYFQELSAKYAEASRYPWLPVAPDPPEPN
jgi:hypothetical protein